MVSRIKHKCSICGKPVQDAFKPFCSPRCATIDLGRWLGEGYKIPAEETLDDMLASDDHEAGD